jgi:hypothetical protein
MSVYRKPLRKSTSAIRAIATSNEFALSLNEFLPCIPIRFFLDVTFFPPAFPQHASQASRRPAISPVSRLRIKQKN